MSLIHAIKFFAVYSPLGPELPMFDRIVQFVFLNRSDFSAVTA